MDGITAIATDLPWLATEPAMSMPTDVAPQPGRDVGR